MTNNHCYHFEKHSYNDGCLSESVDATYIIHLEGNGRLLKIKQQLEKYHATYTTYILFNKGYTKCKKEISAEIPRIDLIDAYLQVFAHAEENFYQNILILEDDFIFDEKILDPSVTSDINDFIVEKNTDCFLYYLGCIPLIQSPSFTTNHNALFASIGTHSVIYSQSARKQIKKCNIDKYSDWDYLMFQMCIQKYMYKEPLCYQLFDNTENQQHWLDFYGLRNLVIWIFMKLELDKSIAGYSFFYFNSQIAFYILIILFFLLFYLLFYLLKRLLAK